MQQDVLQRASQLGSQLVDKWCPDTANELDTIWIDCKKPFAHLFADRHLGDQVSPGWWPLLLTAFADISSVMSQHPHLKFNVVQIKEKFGGLRFYYDVTHPSDTFDEDGERELLHGEKREREDLYDLLSPIIRAAEEAASKTCEDCGKPGELRGGGWLRTLCDEHQEAALKRQKSRGY